MSELTLTAEDARCIAVRATLLSGPRPKSVLAVTQHLGKLQMDPTSVVARSERLVLWSRLGSYDIRALERELWSRRRMFEYWAHIVPMDDFPIHRESMLRYPPGNYARSRVVRDWLRANDSFRRYVLARLRADGPLRSRDLEDRATVPWQVGGWNDGKNLSRMLEILWAKGDVATAGRDGAERIWDLAERRLPVDAPRREPREIARAILERQLRCRGIARRTGFGFAFDGRPPGRDEELRALVTEGIAVPVRVSDVKGTWLVHRDLLAARGDSRTTLLSPFDPLISNRRRTEELFDFRFRLEIYVPPPKREYGYFVLPILHEDRLIGRIDPKFDRRAGRLNIDAIHAEPGAPASAGGEVSATVGALASWLGASSVALPKQLPLKWRAALRSLG